MESKKLQNITVQHDVRKGHSTLCTNRPERPSHRPDTRARRVSSSTTWANLTSLMGDTDSLQSYYQGLSLRGQGQDFFLKAKGMKLFQGQGHIIISRPISRLTESITS